MVHPARVRRQVKARAWTTTRLTWYDMSMSDEAGAVAPYQGGQPVEPSAMADAKQSAVFNLGQVLKDMIHNSSMYRSENEVLAALNHVDSFVRAFSAGGLNALLTGGERAPVEDVSLRTPPSGAVAPVMSGPSIDYAALARAIMQEQQKIQGNQG